MQLSDSEEVREILSSVGMNHFKYDNKMMLISDPEGTVVAQDITTGKLLGLCSGINLSSDLAFINIYAVKPEYQGLGIGSALWDKAIEHIGDRNVIIYTGDKKIENYYKNCRNFSVVHKRKKLIMTGNPVLKSLTDSIPGICLVDMNDKNIADVIEYDKQVCDGLDRSVQLRALNGQFKTASLVAIDKCNNKVMGYGTILENTSEKTMPSYTIRTMQLSDNEEVRDVLVSVDMNQFKYTTEMILTTDPEGAFVAQDITTGKLLGLCSGTNLSPELAYLCIYAVRPEYQGLGIGSALWDKAIEHIGDRNASLYASEPKVIDVYKNRQNFNKIPERRELVYKGNFVTESLITSIDGISVVDMNDNNIADVIEYDKQVCDGLDRSAQLRALNVPFKTASLVAINDSNKVKGFCFLWENIFDSEAVRKVLSSVGMNHFKYAIEMMFISDPEGTVVAQDTITGKLLGLCSGINLSSDLSYMNIYAVKPEYQRLGIGSALWDKAIEHIGDRNVILYPLDKEIENYYKTRHNFTVVPKRRRLIMTGNPVVNALTDSIRGICLVDMNDKNIADVIEYDKQVCDGLDRSAQLRALNGQFKTASLVAIEKCNNKVIGYCFVFENLHEYQRLGIGSALWDKAIEHIGDRNAILYPIDKDKENSYKNRYNFTVVPKRRIHIMTGNPVINGLSASIHGISLVDMNDKNIADVIEYDKQVCDGLNRTVQLRALNGQFKTANTKLGDKTDSVLVLHIKR
ncbi:unnamed protein product [Medioppia subpectinata]|uniref:N-acetyltransferase domain-containing protein n=1 Tax=Medioppia subpectinata TaxID=1979941 RepID=A0A7R9KBJ3_9ACAR|nr:unnamed protein product [Medioppia subpectinata]CAG2100151.1 unnamed protein product [Medioppia subpectinata]